MTPEQMELREKIRRLIGENLGWPANDQARFATIADAILAIPEIAEALKAHERLIGKPNA